MGWKRVVLGLLVLGAMGHLGYQTVRGNFVYHSEPANPWVYAHPTRDVFAIAGKVQRIASVLADDETVMVVCRDFDYWPLPWYLRDEGRIGYTDNVDELAAQTAVVVTFADQEREVLERLYGRDVAEKRLYVPGFEGALRLRPHLPMAALVRMDVYERLEEGR